MNGTYTFNVRFATVTREPESIRVFTVYPIYTSTMLFTNTITLQGTTSALATGNMALSGSAVFSNVNSYSIGNFSKGWYPFTPFSGSSKLEAVASSNVNVNAD